MRREFQPLRFTPGKRGGGLSQAQISEADFVQHFQFGNDLWSIDEKCQRLAHRELQNLMDVFVVVTDFQHAALEARAAAFLADELDVREKLHFHGDRAVALARLAAPARHVERKIPSGIIKSTFRILCSVAPNKRRNLPFGLWRLFGTGMRNSPLRYRPVSDLCSPSMASYEPEKSSLPPSSPAPGPRSIT